jgi:hypothetical protein
MARDRSLRLLLAAVGLGAAVIAVPGAATAATAAGAGAAAGAGRLDTGNPSVKAHAARLKAAVPHDRCVSKPKAAAPTEICLHRDSSGAAALTPEGQAARRTALRTPATVKAAGGTVAPAVAVAPAQCGFGRFSGANQPDRFTSCTDSYWELYTYIKQTGQVTGWLDFEDLQYIVDNTSLPSWKHGFTLVVYDGQGDLVNGTPVTMTTGCILNPSACENGARQFGADAGGAAWKAVPYTNWSSEWDEYDNGAITTTAKSVDFLDPDLGVQISGQGPYNPWTWSDIHQGLVARCDNIVGPADDGFPGHAGCVNDEVTPTLTYDATRYPLVGPVAQHIYTAQAAARGAGGLITKWGVQPIALYRDSTKSDIDANRRVACGKVSIPDGSSCDEFPMASTYEGAAFQSDYSTAIVPASANNSQGGLTSSFYSGNRVIDTDPFFVRAVLANGTASW